MFICLRDICTYTIHTYGRWLICLGSCPEQELQFWGRFFDVARAILAYVDTEVPTPSSVAHKNLLNSPEN